MRFLYIINCLISLLLTGNLLGQANSNDLSKLSIKELSDSIRAKPSNSSFYYYRGLINLNASNQDLALDDFSKTIKLDPKDINAYIKRGGIYYQKKKYDQALSDFVATIQLNPDLVNIYYNRGLCYFNLKRYDLANKDFTTYISRNPQKLEPYKLRAISYQNLKHDSLAINDFTSAIKLNDTIHTLYIGRGQSYYILWNRRSINYKLSPESANYRWKVESGVEDFFKALSLNPKSFHAYSCLINIVFTLKEDFAFENSYAKILANSGRISRLDGKSLKSLEESKLKASIGTTRIFEILDRLIIINPELPAGYTLRAATNNVLDKANEAIKDCNKAIALDSEYDYAYFVRADAYKKLEQYNQSLNDLTNAIKLKPNAAHYYNSRGEIYKVLGKRDLALKDFLQAVKLEPKVDSYQKNIDEIEKK